MTRHEVHLPTFRSALIYGVIAHIHQRSRMFVNPFDRACGTRPPPGFLRAPFVPEDFPTEIISLFALAKWWIVQQLSLWL